MPTIEFETGYTLPGGDQPLKNARILHKGNQRLVKTITASSEVSDYPGTAANNGTTVDRWKPFSNGLSDAGDMAGDEWTATNLTIDADGNTLTETTATGQHDISQAYTFTAVEHVVAFKVTRQTVPEVQVRANDGTSSFTCFFDLRDGTVGTASGCVGQIVDLGDSEFLLSIYFTPLAAAGVVELLLSDGAETVSYAGSTDSTIFVSEAVTHASEATLRFDLFAAQSCDIMALAAHNLFSGAGRVQFQHDSNNDDTWTTLATSAPTDNGPVMCILEPVTSSRWRIVVDRCVLPEIGVFRVGLALQMARPFYAGFARSRNNRQTETLGNISGSGELLGRSRKRSILTASYQWAHLSDAWVRANIDGPNGIIQAVETEPFFAAWRPGETSDVDYFMRASTQAPSAMGIRDLHDFSLEGEVHSYE